MVYPQSHYRGYGDDFAGQVSYNGRTYGYSPHWRATEVTQALEPLIAHLRIYDAHRLELERQGGTIQDLKQLTEILRQEITIPGRYRDYRVSLTDQNGLRDLLLDVGNLRLHLGVRQLDTRLPVYYLCRLDHQYRSLYDLVIEDLYLSPGYPLPDERFVKFMRRGHELYHLRLSPFRGQAIELLGKKKLDEVDALLSQVGGHIFQAAWHEDQRLGVMVARQFDLPLFLQAIEVLYLCLSGEHCEIRSATTDKMFWFFKMVYPQPAIYQFLKLLRGLEGGALTGLSQRALKLYTNLSQAFNHFLTLKLPWGVRREPVTMQKLIFGNFSRLPLVARVLQDNPELAEARGILEHESRAVVQEMLGTPESVPEFLES